MSFLLKTIGLDIAFRATADFLANHQYLLSSFFFPLRYRVCWYVFVWVLVWFVCVCSYSRRYFLVVLGTVLFTCFITLIDDLRYNFFLLLFCFISLLSITDIFRQQGSQGLTLTACVSEFLFLLMFFFCLLVNTKSTRIRSEKSPHLFLHLLYNLIAQGCDGFLMLLFSCYFKEKSTFCLSPETNEV